MGEKVQPTQEQIAASKARREAQQAQALAAKERVANTPKGGIWTGKPVSQTWRNHIHRGSVRNAAISTGIAALASGGVLASQRRRDVAKLDRRQGAQTAGGAVAGAATMDALNTVGGQSAKAVLKERRNRRGFSPNEEKRWAEHKQKVLGLSAGKPVPNDNSVPQHVKAKLYRTAPKGSIPDRTANRLLAFKNTKGWTGGSLAGAAVVGGLAAHRRSVNKSLAEDLPRAVARTAKKTKEPRRIPSPEEIARLQAEKAARRAAEGKVAGPAQMPKADKAPAEEAKLAAARTRSSFLGAGQKRDLAVGVPLGGAALAYGLHRPKHMDAPSGVGKRDSRKANRVAAGVAGATATGAHVAEAHQLKRGEREVHRVISANNADVVGPHAQADRGIHASRAISHLDNVRALRGLKTGAAAAGVLALSQNGKVHKRDDRKTAAGAIGGAALLDSADTMVGASLKRGARYQRDAARRKNNVETNELHTRIFREHAKKHGFLDPSRPSRGAGSVPVSAPHAQKHAFYRSYPTALPGARLQKLNALRDKKTAPILAAGALLGGGAAAHRQKVAKGNHFVVAGQLSGATGAGAYLQARRDGRHRDANEIAGATVGGWAGQGAYQGGGYGYRNAVRGLHGSKVPRHELPHLDPKADFANDPEGGRKREQNIRERAELKRHHPRLADAKRNTPAHWHGARMERILGRTHAGKTGTLVGAGMTVGGGMLGMHAAKGKNQVKKAYVPRSPARLNAVVSGPTKEVLARHSGSKHAITQPFRGNKSLGHLRYSANDTGTIPANKKGGGRRLYRFPEDLYGETHFKAYGDTMSKSVTYGYMEERRNKKRATQQAAGVGLAAHGASRLNLGRQADAGVRYASAKGHGDTARSVVRHGRAAAAKTRHVTGQAEDVLRHIPGFGGTFDRIPRKLRPAATLGAGALLAARATPSKDERFVPTGGW